MKVVILAGGLGTRIGEETHLVPKPMIAIGQHPILWHIMKIYSHYGFNDFLILAGYKQEIIKDYFVNYVSHHADITVDLLKNEVTLQKNPVEPWKVTIVDTGYGTMTGGRLKRAEEYIGDEPFFLTYGDAVADIDIPALAAFHKAKGHVATVTAANIAQMKGILSVDADGRVEAFREKEETDSSLINGGFMVLEPRVFSYLKDDNTVFEKDVLPRLAREGELDAFADVKYWQCMDTQREKKLLETLWEEGSAPWKVWD